MSFASDSLATDSDLERAGFRLGARGTLTSRTIMLRDLEELLAFVPETGASGDYADAVLDENVLGKRTAATRRASLQRLREYYGLDLRIPLFRVLRRLWKTDVEGRPRIALLAAMARDPLFGATVPVVLPLREGEELMRSRLLDALRGAAGDRMNEAVLDKTARHAASSWAQAGFLSGRVRKLRRLVSPTPGTVALAAWLGRQERLPVSRLLSSDWARSAGDGGPRELLAMALKANQLGLIRARHGGGVLSIDPSILDPEASR